MSKSILFMTGLLLVLIVAMPVETNAAEVCVAPDNGTGTVTYPADCPFTSEEKMMIIDGLPPGTTIEMDPTFDNFICGGGMYCSLPLGQDECETDGASLGGTGSCFEATLDLTVSGTGTLAGFNRHLAVPIFIEIHSAPRIPGDPVQTFDNDMYRLTGELFGDPDFCTFRVTGGTNYGLPSPGATELTDLGDGNFNVDSFFDITYQIEFEGCPGSILDDYYGTTTATLRMRQGVAPMWQPGDGHKMHYVQLPDEEGWNVMDVSPMLLADDWECSDSGAVTDITFWGSWQDGAEGTIDEFNVSIYSDIPDPEPGNPSTYSMPGELLWSKVIPFGEVNSVNITPNPQLWEGWHDPITDVYTYPDHDNYFQYDIRNITEPFIQNQGTIYWLGISANLSPQQPLWGWKSTNDHWNDDATWLTVECVAPDNGTGTITYPADCSFTSPEDVMFIIDGLPPGTTIELDPEFMSFNCTGTSPYCSLPILPGECEVPGGSLGGTGSCFEATLDLDVSGTGDLAGFNRHLAVPIYIEVHSGPRNPGDPVQTFANDMYRLQGELFGDPDFCTFRVYGGTDFGLPSPGQTTLERLPNGDFAVESFFDVTYQIEFEGCPGSQLEGYAGTTTATIRIKQGGPSSWQELTEPAEITDPIVNPFYVVMDPGGMVIDGAGADAFGDGWYFYPMEDWWNIWFYDHPLDYNRYKELHLEVDVFPLEPGPSYVEIAFNWATDQWSLDQLPGDSAPPLPGVDENLYIGRQIVFAMQDPEGHYIFDHTLPDYNPEWVSVDIRGFNFIIPEGFIIHQCIPNQGYEQSLDLSFVINNSDTSCCVLRGDVAVPKDAIVLVNDIVMLVDYLFKGGPAPTCLEEGDCAIPLDGMILVNDIVWLVDFLFKGGPAAPPC